MLDEDEVLLKDCISPPTTP